MPGVAGCENKEGVKYSEALQMIRTVLAFPVTGMQLEGFVRISCILAGSVWLLH